MPFRLTNILFTGQLQRDGEGDARKLIGTMEKEDALKKIAFGGRKLALDTFKWKAIGTR